MNVVLFFRDDGFTIPPVPVSVVPHIVTLRKYAAEYLQGAADAAHRGDPAAVPHFRAMADRISERVKLRAVS